ncbi:uracil phosphoribosyltransferase [Flammeovirgaceae bacterium SG7u.111]|nr:uracil phosphoribosyltransferase [Flammeovirgaceae bacterium SG7u.132]WPO36203.1 uracil phosphoribosyltransferase [Flammeovirgaceae bacterium SG7u.111]
MNLISSENSYAGNLIAGLRDIELQKNRYQFRFNMERLGEIIAYELSKSLNYVEKDFVTPLGSSSVKVCSDRLVLATILRAGLPFYQGLARLFDGAAHAFIGAYRAPHEGLEDIHINLEYRATPNLEDSVLIVADPMLATGKSLVEACHSLMKQGKPSKVCIVSAIASQPGVDYVKEQLPDCELWIGALDPLLNEKGYIVPGLGDAGDLSFGEKL